MSRETKYREAFEFLARQLLWMERADVLFTFKVDEPFVTCIVRSKWSNGHVGSSIMAIGTAKYNENDAKIGIPFSEKTGKNLAKERAIDKLMEDWFDLDTTKPYDHFNLTLY